MSDQMEKNNNLGICSQNMRWNQTQWQSRQQTHTNTGTDTHSFTASGKQAASSQLVTFTDSHCWLLSLTVTNSQAEFSDCRWSFSLAHIFNQSANNRSDSSTGDVMLYQVLGTFCFPGSLKTAINRQANENIKCLPHKTKTKKRAWGIISMIK